jgi:hypothetical protein
VTGVACSTVAPERASSRASEAPAAVSSRLATTTRAPTIRGRKISSTEMSKATVVTASRVSSAVSPGRSRMAARKLTTERWVIATPFGLPVEPEV